MRSWCLIVATCIGLAAANSNSTRQFPSIGSSGPSKLTKPALFTTGQTPNYGTVSAVSYTNHGISERNIPSWNGYSFVQNGNINIHVIYLHDPAKPAVTMTAAQYSTFETLLRGINGSPWWNILRNYYNLGYQKRHNGNILGLGKEYIMTSTLGRVVRVSCSSMRTTTNSNLCAQVTSNDIPEIIDAQLRANALPMEDNSQYLFVVASSSIVQKIVIGTNSWSLGVDYCGYHSVYNTKLHPDIWLQYDLVGFLPTSQTGCVVVSPTPNGQQIDNMFYHALHEIAETATDTNPCPNETQQGAWCDSSRLEIVDKCEKAVPSIQNSAGILSNAVMGGLRTIVPAMMDPATQKCAITGTSPATYSLRSMVSRRRNLPFCLSRSGTNLIMTDCSTTTRNVVLNSNQQILLAGSCLQAQQTMTARISPTQEVIGTVTLATCNTALAHQKWLHFPDRSIRPAHRQDMCLDIPRASTTNGVVLQLYTCFNTGEWHQQWSFSD